MKRFIFIAFRRFNDYQHTWPFNFEDFTLSNYMYMYKKHNDPIITTRFHCKRNFALWKFRQSEFSPWGGFASANFRYGEISENEISLQWMRNFAKTTAPRLTQRKYASALTKFRGEISSNFRDSKERKTPNFVCISFLFCNLKKRLMRSAFWVLL